MSDIFISYASEDRSRAERLAKVLGGYGWSVWWDRNIPTGQSFDVVIEQALQDAKSVIVLWSKHSVVSDWVKTEAAKAKKRNVLLPALIDDVDLPLEFSRLQTQSLVDWQEGTSHLGFDQFIKDISALLGAQPTGEGRQEVKPQRKPLHPAMLLSLPTIIIGLTLLVLMMWRIPTRVRVDLTADRVAFTIGEMQPQSRSILDSVEFRSLTIEKFSKVSFEPQKVEIANPAQYRKADDTFPASAWTTLTVTSPTVGLIGKEGTLHPRVTVERREDASAGSARLESVRVTRESAVTLEAREQQSRAITLKLAGVESRVFLSMLGPFEMIADHTEVSGLEVPNLEKYDSLTYRMQLKRERYHYLEFGSDIQIVPPINDSSAIEITGEPGGLILSMTLLLQQPVYLFSRDAIPVTALDFTRQDKFGNRVTALIGEGTIIYPDYPSIGSVQVTPLDFIGFGGLQRFRIMALSLDPGGKGINLLLDGICEHIMTKTGDFSKDHRLTQLDVLWHTPRLFVALIIVMWILPTTLGAYRLYRRRGWS